MFICVQAAPSKYTFSKGKSLASQITIAPSSNLEDFSIQEIKSLGGTLGKTLLAMKSYGNDRFIANKNQYFTFLKEPKTMQKEKSHNKTTHQPTCLSLSPQTSGQLRPRLPYIYPALESNSN